MIEMQKGTFRSVTGQKLDRRLWLPEGEVRGVVQFVHGMAEHIDRYDAPARALAAAGFAVTGHNHLGHGPKGIIKGYFADKDGWLPETYHNGDGMHLNSSSFTLELENLRTHAFTE